jgi:Na+/H+ antiporter NhaD/arsenite permease-like protein
MELFIVFVFVIGYIAITIEHQIKIDKLIPALLMMALAWAGIALGIDDFSQWFDPHNSQLDNITSIVHEGRMHLLENTLLHHFGKTAEILIFLMGAMAIVEMIDHFEGFGSIKKMIKTKSKINLLWILSFLGFFLSAIIDNLTATIVLITILRKIIPNQNDRMWYAGFIIIAANAGGAWTPIGDVTTTMLWMAGKVTTGKLISLLALPSLINILIPLIIGTFLPTFKGKVSEIETETIENKNASFMLILGLALIIFVPIFKTYTHLPPYIGMMLSLSIFALVSEFISNRTFSLTNITNVESSEAKSPTLKALGKIEIPSVLFFLGILMTIAAMETLGLIFNFGQIVSSSISENLFVTLLGVSSAIIDNVPLVAASIGMFQDVSDANVWHFIAYAAGTGGSMLIIGSAAGVVAMGMEKISFVWYLKNISLLAFLGYIAGIGAFLILS